VFRVVSIKHSIIPPVISQSSVRHVIVVITSLAVCSVGHFQLGKEIVKLNERKTDIHYVKKIDKHPYEVIKEIFKITDKLKEGNSFDFSQ